MQLLFIIIIVVVRARGRRNDEPPPALYFYLSFSAAAADKRTGHNQITLNAVCDQHVNDDAVVVNEYSVIDGNHTGRRRNVRNEKR